MSRQETPEYMALGVTKSEPFNVYANCREDIIWVGVLDYVEQSITWARMLGEAGACNSTVLHPERCGRVQVLESKGAKQLERVE